jgi:hypothetical protein
VRDLSDRHSATQEIMRFFEFGHLPESQRRISAPVCLLAERLVDELADGPELTTGLRKLLEAKDCFVRASL